MANQSTELVRIDPQALVAQAVEKGSGIETLERLLALAKDVRAEQAREAWNQAMADFQRTCPRIKKGSSARIRTRSGGQYGYSYASLDEIMSTILPVMGPLGLSVSWRCRMEPQQVVANCRVSHVLGHFEESGEIAMPIVIEDFGANPAQRVGIASTYGKRYALLAIIGLAPEDDADADPTNLPPEDREGSDSFRREEAIGTTSRPRAAEPAPSSGTWTGKILEVGMKPWKSGGKEGKVFIVKCEGGKQFGTYSDTFADAAGSIRKSGKDAEIEWRLTNKGNAEIASIAEVVS